MVEMKVGGQGNRFPSLNQKWKKRSLEKHEFKFCSVVRYLIFDIWELETNRDHKTANNQTDQAFPPL